MPHTDEETVRRIIQESFEGTLYPGDDNLVESSSSKDPDVISYNKLLRGKRWKKALSSLEKLEGRSLNFYQSMFHFLTPEAYCYYAPAFLIRCLDLQTDTFGYNLRFTLNPVHYQDDHRAQRFAQRMQLFSDRQKHAIALAVDYMIGAYVDENRRIGNLDEVHLWEYWSEWRGD